jgi:hypothetical protein
MVFVDVTLRILVDDGQAGLSKAQEVRRAAEERLRQKVALVCVALHDGENPVTVPTLVPE